jgi:hypothetical protein
MFMAWAEMVETRPGEREALMKGLKHMLGKHTSIAQEINGLDAESLGEFELLHVLHHAEKIGILDHGLYETMKKKKRLGLFWLIFAAFRDTWKIGLAITAVQAGKLVGDTAKAAA